MALCPFAIQRPVSSHGGPTGAILGVVEHVTAGEGDPYNEFANPANQVSSHFGIGNGQGGMGDGVLEQYVDTSLMSWAQAAGNAQYLSVETEGQPTDPLTPAQIATFGRLLAWMHATYAIPLVIADTPGQRGLITHGDGGAAWGGHTGCPGAIRAAQRQAIIDAAGGTPPAPTPTPTPTPAEDTMLTITPALASQRHGDVVTLQALLNAKGGAHLTVDGLYGPASQQALRNWQAFFGLSVDGIAGPASWSTLLHLPIPA